MESDWIGQITAPKLFQFILLMGQRGIKIEKLLFGTSPLNNIAAAV